jgi:large subunit ribosomal protein L14e
MSVANSLQVIVDNPSDDSAKAVPRHSAALSHLALTSIEIEIPRAIGKAALRKKWDAAGIDKKWDDGNFAQSRAKSAKRRNLNDFERFKAMRLRKQVRFDDMRYIPITAGALVHSLV